MAGHSKWANRQYRKGRQDAVRGRLFSKCSREIIVAAREGGGNPDTNNRLRLAVQAAKDVSMPADNIERAIKRGTGELEGVDYEEATFEGYGPGGVALFIRVLTDNRDRTVADIRHILKKRGGSLGESGCTAFMFQPKGVLMVEKAGVEEDRLLEVVMEAGAEDLVDSDDAWEVRTAPTDFQVVRDALQAAGIELSSSELGMVPTVLTEVDDDKARSLLALLEELDDHDDIQKVYANFDISDEVLESVAG